MADESSLVQLLQACSEVLPPIRGAINGAMVLDDTVMERITFEQWRNGVRPKVDSSRNLDKHLPDMCFYIMLSSVAGVAGLATCPRPTTPPETCLRMRRRATAPQSARGKSVETIDLGAVSGGICGVQGGKRRREAPRPC